MRCGEPSLIARTHANLARAENLMARARAVFAQMQLACRTAQTLRAQRLGYRQDKEQ